MNIIEFTEIFLNITLTPLQKGLLKDMEQWTNRDFAAANSKFQACCEKARIKPTKRQASKYRRKYGAAYKISLEWKEVG